MQKKYLFEEVSKDKIHPRSGREGPEGEQRHSCILPSTSVPYPDCFPQERDLVPITEDGVWVLGPVWMGVENFTPTRI